MPSLYVAQKVGETVAAQAAPKLGAQQAKSLGAQQAQTMVDAVHQAFADAVAHTSVVGAVVLGVGTVLVAFLLPRGVGKAESSAKSEQQVLEKV
ncbi:hypothetical protein GCM10020000_24820 [Streptomyces olivoverticillatus]